MAFLREHYISESLKRFFRWAQIILSYATFLLIWGPSTTYAAPESIPIVAPSLQPSFEEDIDAQTSFEESFDYWINRQASLRLKQSTQMSPTGFGVPAGRGRHAGYTRVFVNGLQLDDPLTGYSSAEDLDLRFFDDSKFNLGIENSPYTTPSGGVTIDLNVKPLSQSQNRLGLQTGSVYGNSIWYVGTHNFLNARDQNQIQNVGLKDGGIKTYFRSHRTRGNYPIYDDQQTPGNPHDDTMATMKNNHQKSEQVIALKEFQAFGVKGTLLARGLHKQRGIAPVVPQVTTYSHSEKKSWIVLGNFAPDHFSSKGLSPLNFSWGMRGESLTSWMINQPMSPTLISQDRHILTSEVGVHSNWLLMPSLTLVPLVEAKQTSIKIDPHERQTTVNAQRQMIKGQISLAIEGANQKLVLKSVRQNLTDRSQLDVQDTQDWGLTGQSAFWEGQYKNLSAFGQISDHQDPPGLMVTYGDGQGTEGSLQTVPESIRHQEMGVMWKPSKRLKVQSKLFSDQISQKILSVPVSLGERRYVNVSQVNFVGREINWEMRLGDFVLRSYATWLQSQTPNADQIPGIANHYQSHEVQWQHQSVSVFLLSRFQDDIYLDLSNKQKLPRHWEFSCGGSIQTSYAEFGLEVFNLADRRRLAYDTTNDQGFVPYSHDGAGALPGRHARLSLTATME